jgi:hypothetical protein
MDQATEQVLPVEKTARNKRVHNARVDYALAATMLAAGMNYGEIAAKFGVTRASLRVGLSRKGVSRGLIEHRAMIAERAGEVATKVLASASERLRGMLSNELERTTGTLAKIKPKECLGDIEARSKVAESIARTAKIVHDWGADSLTGLVVIGQTRSADAEERPAIDVQVEQVE